MAFARTKLLIWDYIFEPVKDINISYMGPHPENFYASVKDLIKAVFNVPDAYVQEKTYNWEKGKESEKFEIEWEVNKILDTFSYITVELTLKGFSAGGEGKADIRIRPRLITEYPQDTVWQQNLIYEMFRRFWHTRFYTRKRLEYLNYAKELLVSFETSVKKYAEKLRKDGA
ncbi:MAG: hypothetical protein NT120_02975 [Candidatus Aenigmarchaeota archaeon]|nr:hypothetical protein [Candidatus Aenigmarchaeota archaeon]